MTKTMITYDDFEKIDIRVGKILEVHDFPKARKPAYQLLIDFGSEIGLKKSSAQIVSLYSKEDLIGKLVVAVVNFPPRQIANFMSEVLTLGVPSSKGETILLTPDMETTLGGRMY